MPPTASPHLPDRAGPYSPPALRSWPAPFPTALKRGAVALAFSYAALWAAGLMFAVGEGANAYDAIVGRAEAMDPTWVTGTYIAIFLGIVFVGLLLSLSCSDLLEQEGRPSAARFVGVAGWVSLGVVPLVWLVTRPERRELPRSP